MAETLGGASMRAPLYDTEPMSGGSFGTAVPGADYMTNATAIARGAYTPRQSQFITAPKFDPSFNPGQPFIVGFWAARIGARNARLQAQMKTNLDAMNPDKILHTVGILTQSNASLQRSLDQLARTATEAETSARRGQVQLSRAEMKAKGEAAKLKAETTTDLMKIVADGRDEKAAAAQLTSSDLGYTEAQFTRLKGNIEGRTSWSPTDAKQYFRDLDGLLDVLIGEKPVSPMLRKKMMTLYIYDQLQGQRDTTSPAMKKRWNNIIDAWVDHRLPATEHGGKDASTHERMEGDEGYRQKFKLDTQKGIIAYAESKGDEAKPSEKTMEAYRGYLGSEASRPIRLPGESTAIAGMTEAVPGEALSAAAAERHKRGLAAEKQIASNQAMIDELMAMYKSAYSKQQQAVGAVGYVPQTSSARNLLFAGGHKVVDPGKTQMLSDISRLPLDMRDPVIRAVVASNGDLPEAMHLLAADPALSREQSAAISELVESGMPETAKRLERERTLNPLQKSVRTINNRRQMRLIERVATTSDDPDVTRDALERLELLKEDLKADAPPAGAPPAGAPPADAPPVSFVELEPETLLPVVPATPPTPPTVVTPPTPPTVVTPPTPPTAVTAVTAVTPPPVVTPPPPPPVVTPPPPPVMSDMSDKRRGLQEIEFRVFTASHKLSEEFDILDSERKKGLKMAPLTSKAPWTSTSRGKEITRRILDNTAERKAWEDLLTASEYAIEVMEDPQIIPFLIVNGKRWSRLTDEEKRNPFEISSFVQLSSAAIKSLNQTKWNVLTQEQEAEIRAYLAELHAAYEGTVVTTAHAGAKTYRTERTSAATEPPTLRTWE